MKNLKTKTTCILVLRTLCLFAFLFCSSAFTESTNGSLNYKSNSNSKMMLSGYANLNNWTMGSSNLNSAGSFTIKDGALDEINTLQFDISTSSLKSEDASIDSVLYAVLAKGETQKISFRLTRQMVLPMMKMVHLVGDFTMAGVTRSISLQMSYEMDQNNNIKFSGTNTISLRDFTSQATAEQLKALKCNDQLAFTLALNLQAGL